MHMEGTWLLAETFGLSEDLDDYEAWVDACTRIDIAPATYAPIEEERAESQRQSGEGRYCSVESKLMWRKGATRTRTTRGSYGRN